MVRKLLLVLTFYCNLNVIWGCTGLTSSFTVNSLKQCLATNSFVFTSSSTITSGSISNYSWNYGDGSALASGLAGFNTRTKVYTTAGVYKVVLTITMTGGCTDTISKWVTVYPRANRSIAFNTQKQCLRGNNFVMTNTSTIASPGNPLTWSWAWGDATSDTAKSPSHTYSTSGIRKIILTMTSANGCIDTISKTIVVFPQASIAFTVNNAAQCLRTNNFAFFSSSTVAGGTITNSWNYGDGSANVTGGFVTKSYTLAGNYKVLLTTTTNNGCTDTLSKFVKVYPRPNPAISFNTQKQCRRGNSFVMTNTSTASAPANPLKWSWAWGDATTDTAKSPSHTYANAGTYKIILTITTANGCTDTISKTVVVFPQATTLAYTMNNNSQCLKTNSFTFTSTSAVTGGTITNKWDYGDGSATVNGSPVTKNYSTAGTYRVLLTTTTNNGCIDTISRPVFVRPQASPSFTINTSKQCLRGNSFTYTSTSTISSGTMTYAWNYGDATVATGSPVTKTYATAGNFKVILTTTSNYACTDTVSKFVTVYPQANSNIAFNTQKQCLKGNNFVMTNTSTIANPGNMMKWSWDWGDATSTDTAKSPSHTYNAAGNYKILLTITTANNCTDTISKTVVVSNKASTSFTINNATQCLRGNSFTFTSTSTVTGGTVANNWNYGDGSATVNGSPVTKTYATAGTYKVLLTTTTNSACIDTLSKYIKVYPQATRNISFNTQRQCLKVNSFVMTNNSTVANPGNMMKWLWAWGDTKTDTAKSPTHNYTTAGTYKIILTMTTANGCTDTISKTIVVLPQASIAFNINNTAQCLRGNSFTFTSSSTVTGGTLINTWNYGDGSATVNGSPVTKAYTNAGTYKVLLTTTTNNACIDTLSKFVSVYPQATRNISFNTQKQCLKGNSFVLTNSSTIANPGNMMKWLWTWGDTKTDTAKSPTHNYATAGTYKILLTITSANNCTDTISKTIVVWPQATVAFAINNAAQCLRNNSFTFTSSSTVVGGTLTNSWNYGDGSSTVTGNPVTKSYTSAASYRVLLTTTTNNGCVDTLSKGVTVYPQANPSFSVNSMSQCFRNNSFTISSTSTISTGSLTGFAWTYGDATTGTGSSVTKTYSTYGNYKVILTTTSNNNCRDTVSKFLKVYPQANLNFSLNSLKQCFKGNSFTVTNNSSIPPVGNPLTYSWSWGDAKMDTIKNPTHRYSNDGVYQLILFTKSANNCSDTLSKWLEVYPQAIPDFYYNQGNQCLRKNAFVFTSKSTLSSGTMTYLWDYGDGSTLGTGSSTSKSYINPGKYPVTLITTTDHFCKDTLSRKVVVNPQTSQVYTLNQSQQCLKGNVFRLQSKSSITSGTIAQESWSFGDGYFKVGASSSHSYSKEGQYLLTYITVSDSGCRDTMNQKVDVFPQAKNAFTINSWIQCFKGNKFLFNNLTWVISGSIAQNKWDFGDGTFSNLQNPTHNYLNFGNYNVMLITQTNNGCLDSSSLPVSVNASPVSSANLNAGIQCLRGNQFVFSNKSKLALGTMKQIWSFGDGYTDTSFNVAHRYLGVGIFKVQLVSSSSQNCTDTFTTNIEVKHMPKADFKFGSVCEKNALAFTNTSSIAAGTLKFSNWSFGDGNVDYVNNPLHIYNTYGQYITKLIVVSDFGCADTSAKTVKVDRLPILKYSVKDTCLGLTTIFRSNSQAGSGGITSERWDFGTGSVLSGTSVPQKFNNPGNHSFKLIVTNTANCVDSMYASVTIEVPPVADFNFDQTCINIPVNFTDQSYTQNGTLDQYYWMLAPNFKSNAINALYTFTKSGTYTMTHVVRNSFGCFDTATQSLTINPPVIANFDHKPTESFMLDDVYFNNLSQNATKYDWDFGDNNYDNATNPTHVYDLGGDYTVTLIAQNNDGCADTAIKNIHIRNKPLYWIPSAFTPSKTENMNDNFGLETPLKVHNYHMLIYNRWGEILFESYDINNRWDATYNGQRVLSDVYTYVIFFYDIDGFAFNYSGAVTVVN